MKNRELLELTAKAAGLNFDPTFHGRWGLRGAADHDQGEPYDWNPLTDDGDALRLASTLKFCVDTAVLAKSLFGDLAPQAD